MLLSLDISTSCVGWAVWKDRKLVDAGAIEMKESSTAKKKNKLRWPTPFDKMDYVRKELDKVIQKHGGEVAYLAAEAALKKFSGGKTTANTMALLIGFNFCLCYNLTRDLDCKHVMIDVKSARRKLKIVIPRGAKDKKKYVIAKIKPMYPNLSWPLKNTGKEKDWCGDQADAIVVGLDAIGQMA
jgi:hypothetical protein